MTLANLYMNFTTEVTNEDRPTRPWEDKHPMAELQFKMAMQ